MASIKTVERQIGNIEGFDVRFCHPNRKDVRSDKTNIPGYNFQKAAKGATNVATWKEQRFKQVYPGFECDVLNADGSNCHGATLLSNVRDSYTD